MTVEELDELQYQYDKGNKQAQREVLKIMVEAGVMIDEQN